MLDSWPVSASFQICDSHCHLDAVEFDDDREDVLGRAAEAGVSCVIVPGTDMASSRKVKDLVPAIDILQAYGAVGVHPHEAKELDGSCVAELETLSRQPHIVAIGETGLDYHYNFSPPDVQQASLRDHVRLAVRCGLPLILHCRNAEDDLLRILVEEEGTRCGGVVHCYTGTLSSAERLLGLGFYLGFTGIVTFRNSAALRDVARQVPISRILLETDAPYLAPVPYRGKRNEPGFIPRIAETMALLHERSPAEVAAATYENTRRCFHLGGC